MVQTAFFLAACLLVVEGAPGPPPPAPVRLALAQIAEAKRLAGGLDRLLPGFGSEQPAMAACLGEAGTLLVGHPGGPGWTELPAEGGEAGLWRPGCPWDEDRQGPPARPVSIKFEGRETLWLTLGGEQREFRLGGLLAAPRGGPPVRAGQVSSEDAVASVLWGLAFEWARRVFPRQGEPPAEPLPPESARRDDELARQEARLLVEALDAPKAKHARRPLSRFRVIRSERIQAAPNQAVTLRIEERRAGLALYAVYHALLLGRHDPGAIHGKLREIEPDFTYMKAPELREELMAGLTEAGRPGGTPEAALSGFALSLLLDRTVHGWREALFRTGAPLDELLSTLPRPGRHREEGDSGGPSE
jgi:hypothetical protein